MATPIPENRATFTIEEVALATRGVLARGSRAGRVTGIVSDHRSVRPGGAFVALVGEKHDGHAFGAAAAKNGAALLVVERGHDAMPLGDADVRVVEVEDTLVAWGDLARFHLERWRARAQGKVVAITGSAGKTTTKELTRA